MKNKMLIILILSGLLLIGCQKQKFNFVLDLNQVITYHVDQTGPFELASAISKGDVLQLVNISEDADITDVQIQTLAISVTVREGNTVDKVNLTLFYKDLQSGKEKIFNDYPVPITGLFGITNPYSPVSLLLDSGVSKVKNKLKGYLRNEDNFDYEVVVNGDTGNKRLVADIKIKVIATVEYSECLTVLEPFSNGQECDSEPGF